MFKSIFIILINLIFSHPLLKDGDPLLDNEQYWSPSLIEKCSAFDYAESFVDPKFTWRIETEQCTDDPQIAFCYIARKFAISFQTCEQATSDTQLCAAFPDALTNYCCASRSLSDSCLAVGGASSVESEDAIAQAAQAARPYFPESPKKLPEEEVEDQENREPSPLARRLGAVSTQKNLILVWPDRLSMCNLATGVWRIGRLAAMLLDLEALAGMEAEGDSSIADVVERKVSDAINRGLFETLNTILNAPDDKRFSADELDLRKRLSNRSPIPNMAIWDVDGNTRNLQEQCQGVSTLAAEVATLVTQYFSGEFEPGALTDKLAHLIDENVIVVDANKADIEYKKAQQSSRIIGLITPSFMFLPACSAPIKDFLANAPSLEAVAVDQTFMLGQLSSAMQKLLVSLEGCDKCISSMWTQVIDSLGEAGPAAGPEEGERLQQTIVDYARLLAAEVEGIENGTISPPQSPGELFKILMKLGRDVAKEQNISSASFFEMAMVAIEAVQKELRDESADNSWTIHARIQKFIREDLGCGMVRGRSLTEIDLTLEEARALIEKDEDDVIVVSVATSHETDEEEGGVAAGEFRQLIPRRNQPVSKAGPLDITPRRAQPDGNLTPPLGGYQCRDDIRQFYEDYLQLWLSRANCGALIETFGCTPQGRIIPFPVLLNACPMTWSEVCKRRVTPAAIAMAVQALPPLGASALQDEDNNSTVTDETEEQLDADIKVLVSQLEDPRPYEPFTMCLGGQYRREAQQESREKAEVSGPGITVDDGEKKLALEGRTEGMEFPPRARELAILLNSIIVGAIWLM